MFFKTCKKIGSQYADDMRSIGRSNTAKILFVLLAFVPSLYAWFNIAGSWDPYANTGSLKIAIVNEDHGADIKGSTVNIGGSAVDELKKSKDLNWQFVDKAKADEGIRTGEYYASIEFPSNLSDKIAQVSTGSPEKGQIIYNYNDKINAIAPKITSHGAISLQEQIEAKIRETFNTVLLQEIVSGGEKLKANRESIVSGINNLIELNSKFPEITQKFNTAMTDAEMLQQALPSLKEALNDSLKKIDSIQSKLPNAEQVFNQINNSMSLIQSDVDLIASNIDVKIQTVVNNLNSLNDLVQTNKPAAVQMVTKIASDLSAIRSSVDHAKMLVGILNQLTGGTRFNQVLSRLTSLSNMVQEVQNMVTDVQTDISNGKTSNTIESMVSKISSDRTLAATIFADAKSVFKTIDTFADNGINSVFTVVSETLTKYRAIIEKINTYITSKEQGLSDAVKQGQEIRAKLPEWQMQVYAGAKVLEPYADGKKIDDLITTLAIDPNSVAQFLNQPVTLEQVRWFPVQNYGAGMTPFYVTLSLWVGALVLVSIMKVHDKQKEKHGIVFFIGRYLVFLTVIIPQSLVVSSGLLLFFGMEATSPLAFVLSTLLIGISFSTIVYTLTYLLGDIGKGLSIVLLVLQIVSAGGTFPIEMMPQFFRSVHFFMPFTYGVSILHETIGGIVVSVFARDAIVLFCIPVAMLLLFCLTHKRLEKSINGLEEELEKAHIF